MVSATTFVVFFLALIQTLTTSPYAVEEKSLGTGVDEVDTAPRFDLDDQGEDNLVREQWTQYKLTYHKKYKNRMEEKDRMKIFADNYHMITEHNKLYEKGLVTYRLRINEWADMSHDEFVQTMNGFNPSLSSGNASEVISFISPSNVKLPDQVDWREEGAVTHVKNQGRCGSCWSFSANGALEGHHFRKTGTLVSLSEQNLIDCSRRWGNHGCHGGFMINAFKYIKDNGGVDTEISYPYEAKENVCRFNAENIGATVTGYVSLPPGDEKALKSAVGTLGPVAVAIDSSHRSFQFHNEGVYYEPKCSTKKLIHAVLAVGYGTDEMGQDYWLVKNSWGESWGVEGYIKMARNRQNHCGIASMASYPLV